MFDDNESHNAGLATGAKIAILAAIPFLLLGIYFLLTPISDLRTTTGAVFACGSAISPASSEFNSNICGPLSTTYLYRAIASIVAGLLIAGAGFFLFNQNSDDVEGDGSGDNGRTRTFD